MGDKGKKRGGSNGPVERVKLKRKDGSSGVGVNREGGTYEAKQIEFMTVWQNAGGKSGSFAPGFSLYLELPGKKPMKLDLGDYFINIFPTDDAARGHTSGDDEPDDDEDF